MANVALRVPLYRLEQIAGVTPTYALQGVYTPDFLATDIHRIYPVNVLGGQDLAKFGYLYSKVTLRQAGLQQEAFSLLTSSQWQTLMNS